MDRLEELWPRCESEPIRIRAIRQTEEPPHQGLSQISGFNMKWFVEVYDSSE